MNFPVTLSAVLEFFKRAIPRPTGHNFHVQLGCHFEGVEELLQELDAHTSIGRMLIHNARTSIKNLADYLKDIDSSVGIANRTKFLDALCDQIVTATGVAYMSSMDIDGGIEEVARSNLSKFDESGFPIFNEQGKIMKGPNYRPANLQPFS